MPKKPRQAEAVGTDGPPPPDENKKTGRPSDFTPELADEICARVATSTDSIRTICQTEGMPDVRTVFRWLRVNKEFNAQYTLAKGEQAELLVEEILEIADNTTNDTISTDRGDMPNKEWINRSRLRVDSRKWLASKLLPKKFGDKVELTGEGAKTEVNITIALSEDRRRHLLGLRRTALDATARRN